MRRYTDSLRCGNVRRMCLIHGTRLNDAGTAYAVDGYVWLLGKRSVRQWGRYGDWCDLQRRKAVRG